MPRGERVHHLDDHRLGLLDVVAGSFAPLRVDHPAVVVDDAGGDLGTADVDADRERHQLEGSVGSSNVMRWTRGAGGGFGPASPSGWARVNAASASAFTADAIAVAASLTR